jgi:Subunit ChlI of Mg-chelatase
MLRAAFAPSLSMLFKTLSASVYGIDAYLVEVEVDVGSARMQDFNVVGLPDNAVKESRERIKSALRNCGFEFPHGQGVTINLAPADVRKEGSAFDLPMALGLTGCMGNFLARCWINACSWASSRWTAACGRCEERCRRRSRHVKSA